MSAQVQYVWLGYQLYATLAMFVYRYGGGHEWATTDSRIAEILAKNTNGESVTSVSVNPCAMPNPAPCRISNITMNYDFSIDNQ